MTVEETMTRAAAVLEGVLCASLHEILEIEDPPPSMAPLVATEEVDFKRALELRRTARGAGISAVIITSFENFREVGLEDWGKNLGDYQTADAEQFFARRAEELGVDAEGNIGAALDKLGDLAGRDPMSVLHRIFPDDLAALESGEDEPDIDFDDLPLPDDVREAHARELLDRAAFIKRARGAGVPAMIRDIRTYDEPTALAELTPRTGVHAHLVLSSAKPFLTLMALGFGGFDASPSPVEHARVWQHWHDALGAEPVVVGEADIEGVIARPVESRVALVRFVREIALYAPDALNDGWLALAARVYRNSRVSFWWD